MRMTEIASILDRIQQAADGDGLPSLAQRSGVPYTTLLDWQRAGWRPKAIRTLERIAAAVDDARPANDARPQGEAAA